MIARYQLSSSHGDLVSISYEAGSDSAVTSIKTRVKLAKTPVRVFVQCFYWTWRFSLLVSSSLYFLQGER